MPLSAEDRWFPENNFSISEKKYNLNSMFITTKRRLGMNLGVMVPKV